MLQHRDLQGWLGPEKTYDSNSLWGRFTMALGLMQMAEAKDSMRDAILTALYEFVPLTNRLLDHGKSKDEVCGRARYADMVFVLQWLYDHDHEDDGPLLLNTMQKLQKHGIDWESYFTENGFPKADIDTIPFNNSESLFLFLRSVNAAPGLKAPGVGYRHDLRPELLAASLRSVNLTLTSHGSAAGGVLGDERLAGLTPTRGTELCSVVELLYSLTHLYQISGKPELADAAERAAFNALPPMITPGQCAHQYIALPNQPWANVTPPAQDGLWWNVDENGTTFDVQPFYPCCAVNQSARLA